MKRQTIINRLEKQGYKVTICFSGMILAKKGSKSYHATSMNGLWNLIQTSLY